MAITIPKSVKYIGEKAFSSCNNLINLSFLENSELEIIDEYAFSNCSFKKIKIPSKVKRIGAGAFCNCSSLVEVEFAPNINLTTIEEFTFKDTKIKKIIIPASVKYFERAVFSYEKMESIEFEENSKLLKMDVNLFDIPYKSICIPDCCQKIYLNTFKFSYLKHNIKIHPKNKNFKILDEKIIIGKADIDSNEFDTLVYAYRDIEHIIIPSYIKYISPYCFQYCKNLTTVEFEPNSQLISIGSKSFCDTSIKSISIPDHVKYIDDYAFSAGESLKSINISENADLESQISFNGDSFHISKNVSQIKHEFKKKKLNHVTISPENKNFKILDGKMIVGKSNLSSNEFDELVFACRDIEHVKVPSYIKIISSSCFQECKQIKSFEFEDNSKLTIINKYAFGGSSIKKITIPKHVKKICKYAFNKCENIETVEFEENTELEIIGGYSFYYSSIKNIIIPQHVKYIKNNAFAFCHNIENIQFEKNSELISIGCCCFMFSTIKQITIPSHTQTVGECAFYECNDLESIHFEENSQLTIIEHRAFLATSIKKILIPKKVKIIEKKAFAYSKIESIEFEENSELCIISEKAFKSTDIKKITIPASVKIIKNFCFFVSKLTRLEFEENSLLHSFNAKAFFGTKIKNIIIPKSNYHNFKCIDDKMIVRKSNPNSNRYDVLVFSYGEIKYLMIPDYINYIDAFCFSNPNLKEIEFSKNSELKTIEKNAFFKTSIEKIRMNQFGSTILHQTNTSKFLN